MISHDANHTGTLAGKVQTGLELTCDVLSIGD